MADYLQSYAEAFDLPVRLNTRVTALRRSPEHDGYLLTTGTTAIRARTVVVATGPFQTPVIPPAPAPRLTSHC